MALNCPYCSRPVDGSVYLRHLDVGKPCPRLHRPPEGPNEDIGRCPVCLTMSFELRPEGETYGHHLPDCSLPVRHESYCQPGGDGHPEAPVIRGYWL